MVTLRSIATIATLLSLRHTVVLPHPKPPDGSAALRTVEGPVAPGRLFNSRLRKLPKLFVGVSEQRETEQEPSLPPYRPGLSTVVNWPFAPPLYKKPWLLPPST